MQRADPDISESPTDVRLLPKANISRVHWDNLLIAKSRLMHCRDSRDRPVACWTLRPASARVSSTAFHRRSGDISTRLLGLGLPKRACRLRERTRPGLGLSNGSHLSIVLKDEAKDIGSLKQKGRELSGLLVARKQTDVLVKPPITKSD
jgi:hypothetical protein